MYEDKGSTNDANLTFKATILVRKLDLNPEKRQSGRG